MVDRAGFEPPGGLPRQSGPQGTRWFPPAGTSFATEPSSNSKLVDRASTFASNFMIEYHIYRHDVRNYSHISSHTMQITGRNVPAKVCVRATKLLNHCQPFAFGSASHPTSFQSSLHNPKRQSRPTCAGQRFCKQI